MPALDGIVNKFLAYLVIEDVLFIRYLLFFCAFQGYAKRELMS